MVPLDGTPRKQEYESRSKGRRVGVGVGVGCWYIGMINPCNIAV